MSLTAVRPYFRNLLDGLGFTEWTDGFDFDNVPETIIDGSYHLTVGTISGNSQNQTAQDISYPVTVQVYCHGYRDPAEAIDDSVSKGQDIICELVKPANSNGTDIKDVQFISMVPTPKDVQNDNIVLLVMEFEARIYLETDV